MLIEHWRRKIRVEQDDVRTVMKSSAYQRISQ